MKSTFIIGLLLAHCFLCAPVAYGNVYKELTLDEKVSLSDTVIIGTVESISREQCMQLNSCADIKVVRVLKGNVSGKVQVLFDGEIAERDPLCCELGASYLFFVQKVDKYYRTVNGPFGVYKLP